MRWSNFYNHSNDGSSPDSEFRPSIRKTGWCSDCDANERRYYDSEGHSDAINSSLGRVDQDKLPHYNDHDLC
ncbi:hypothetical protein KC343_g14594 [Hortaea werneckii]|nr:hypothetical protein KC352_g26308 [Hortaea werneckii]KAI7549185.1 hypothetical protein KC317_g14640 [Hortaea werneckii]KAI7597911.1 hypothetical protein KC346_g14478 [Hortaea werneckii]KAI7603154.1 hypothetical protein KC343_g14594 [Hortaea werneckii]KAI7639613.1 hypothetical protein KC319_g14333 [Hortaea werneckii]